MKKLYLFALVATMFAACATDDTQDLQPVDAPETLTVGFEGGDDNTRVQLNEAGKTVWTKDDLVSVFYLSNANQKWQFQGETGERAGEFKNMDSGNATHKLTKVIVVYPYNAKHHINTETYDLKVFIPNEQTYLKDSYGLNGNVMVSHGYYNQFSLKNVCGWLKVQLKGEGQAVKKITLRGNNGEQVAGEVYVNTADATSTLATEMGVVDEEENGTAGNLVFDNTIYTEVTLNCDKGVELGAEPTAFYIGLPPQTFKKGLTIEIEGSDGSTTTQTTDKEVVIERNHILPMSAIEITPSEPATRNNVILYTATAKVEPYFTDEFGAEYISNVWDSTTGEGVITFNGDVTKIGYYAFYQCDKLTNISIPDSVTEIGDSAFYSCTSLTSVTIPDSVTSIGEDAFYKCTSLISVTIGNSVTSIGNSAFYFCTSLTSVTIPDSVTSIGYYVFLGCDSLTSVTIGNRVTSIGSSTFYNCTSLTSVTIGNSVTSIGIQAFYNCTSLTSVTIPDSVTSIGEDAFENCTSLTSVTIGNSVTSIGDEAFCNCTSLISVTIGNSVTSIGYKAFNECTSLTSVTIPDSVTKIGSQAFYNCISLTSVTIPDSVTSIGGFAFNSCSNLKYVYCKPIVPPSMGNNSFDGNPAGRKIYVPRESVEAYKKAKVWVNYSSHIMGYDF